MKMEELKEALEASDPGLSVIYTRRKSPRSDSQSAKRIQRPKPSEDAIRLRAYLIWERTGKPADDCWHLAKKELER
jgi:Protein of unknown function (DUF2934)